MVQQGFSGRVGGVAGSMAAVLVRPLAAAVAAALLALPAAAGPHALPIIVEDVKLIDPALLKPDSTFHVEVPILGKNTHRTRGNPTNVTMSVHLPANYSPTRAHPVIVHLGGGTDQRKFIDRWVKITGNSHAIILLAEYTSTLVTAPRNAGQMLRILEAATPIKHGSVILAGISSGSWGMHNNFSDQFYGRGYMDPFDAFIFIAGNNNNHITVTANKLGGRPALFVGGNTPAAQRIQKETHESLVAAGANSTYIDMLADYSDFPGDCDPKIMDWIMKQVGDRHERYDEFDKKLEKAKTPDDCLALLAADDAGLHYWYGRTQAATRYLELVRKLPAEEQAAALAKLRDGPPLPRCNGGAYMEQLLWMKEQPDCDFFVRLLGPQNFFIDPVDGHINGYGPGVDFRAR